MNIDDLLRQVESQEEKLKEIMSTYNDCSRQKTISDQLISKTRELSVMVDAITAQCEQQKARGLS